MQVCMNVHAHLAWQGDNPVFEPPEKGTASALDEERTDKHEGSKNENQFISGQEIHHVFLLGRDSANKATTLPGLGDSRTTASWDVRTTASVDSTYTTNEPQLRTR